MIKQFLRPDWRKVILLLILFIFFPVIFPWLSTADCIRTEVLIEDSDYQCDPTWTISTGWVFNAIIDGIKRIPQWTVIRTLPAMWYPFYYIYHFFICYLLSCSMVFAYNKLRKTKQ
ncbi:MAG: hypothetical protein WBC21_02660 [Minisyncoccales bacterium]